MRRPRIPRAVTALATLLLIAGCGDSGDGGDGGDGGAEKGEATKLSVGVSTIGDLAPIYLGRKKGFFRDEGIELDLKPQQGGAITITGVASGDFQVGYSNTTSLLVATTKGLPLRAIAPAAHVGTNPRTEDYTAIMVGPKSDVRRPADLAGKTLAANTVESQTDSTVKAALDAKDVDPASLKFIEIPFPDQVAAVEAGRVGVITPIEPFVTAAKDAGLRTVLPGYFSTAIPNYTTGAYFTSARYMEENPEVIERLRRAIERSLRYAGEHEAEIREIVPGFTGVDSKLARRMALPEWDTEFDRESLERLADVIVKYGLADKRPELDAVFPQGG